MKVKVVIAAGKQYKMKEQFPEVMGGNEGCSLESLEVAASSLPD